MASKKVTAVGQVQKLTSEVSQNSTSGNDASCGNSSGAKRKTKPSGTIVKSRYMQINKKTVAKDESVLMPLRPASQKVDSGHKVKAGTPRQTISGIPNTLETSIFGSSVLQSTVLDGHSIHPDFDVSVIKANTPPTTAVDPNTQKITEMDTFLLTFLTAKIEHNTQKLKKEAERNLLIMMKEEEKLRAKVASKKRQCLHLEKQKKLNDLLDLQVCSWYSKSIFEFCHVIGFVLKQRPISFVVVVGELSSFLQIEALSPLAETAKQFTGEYKAFATAIDATRHKLPVKNLHVEDDGGKILDKVVVCLNQTRGVLEDYTKGLSTDSENSAECLKEIKNAAHESDQLLLSTSSHLLELSSLVCREMVLEQLTLEEDKIGLGTVQNLFSAP